MESNKYDTYKAIKQAAGNLLQLNALARTEESVRNYVEMTLSQLRQCDPIDKEALIREITGEYVLIGEYGDPVVFENNSTEHEIWFSYDTKNAIEWKYWNRYKKYLSDSGMNEYAITSIDRITDTILSKIENPFRDGMWDSRGMVVGYVQSGKTANYTGLICKAADAGYKLIIVLGGTTKDLRYQTQKRIDLGFVGSHVYKDNKKEWVGVGLPKYNQGTNQPPDVTCMTDTDIDSDFRINDRTKRIAMSESNPLCMVIKKNSKVLENVSDWVEGFIKEEGGYVKNIPLLLIDDEADNASLNTRKYESSENQTDNEITTTNKYIRNILHKFEKSAYIGYTATPYANVFVDPDAMSDKYDADIFPRNFIVSMERPPGYFGSDTVFGLEKSNELIGENLFPGIRLVEDSDDLIPPDRIADSTYIPTHLNTSLKEAIRSFIIATAVRDIRNDRIGKRLDNSMLIHVSRYVSAQGINSDNEELQTGISKLVRDELHSIQSNILHPDSSELKYLHELWETSFLPKSRGILSVFPDPTCTDVTWDAVCDRIKNKILSNNFIKIRTLNGGNKDNALDYEKHKDGLTVIAIGGDKLARGLTLEGLTTSYFIRGANTYDSLLQMGRWFGFRFGFVDLCRIYTTRELIIRFKRINEADANLRWQFQNMDDKDRTPANYGLKIIQNDSHFRITQQNKMRSSKKYEDNPYSGDLKQTYKFVVNNDVINHNYEVVSKFLNSVQDYSEYEVKNSNLIWKNIPVEILLDHLTEYTPHDDQLADMGENLYAYIRERNNDLNPELTKWTVVLVNTPGHLKNENLSGHIGNLKDKIGYSIRNPKPINPDAEVKEYPDPFESGGYSYSKNNIMNNTKPSEEAIDLDDHSLDEAFKEAINDYDLRKRRDDRKIRKDAKKPERDNPGSYYIRLKRSVENGLLLIYPITWESRNSPNVKPLFGLVFSFPYSNNAPSVEYRTNKIFQQGDSGDYYE